MNDIDLPEIRGDKVLILGYSREGQSTHKWLHEHYPKIHVDIADASSVAPIVGVSTQVYSGSAYLASLSKYSTVIRSPGIPPHTPELVEYIKLGGFVTSATNIFLSQFRDQTVGVTGTKGKSTTASLIAHILKSSVSDVRLVGNIGLPMLDHIESVTSKTVFVAELSSHQLSDARYSPQIAVLLAIQPEHLDYYPNIESYIHAKANITRFQSPQDAFICNLSASGVSEIAIDSPAQKFVYNTESSAGTSVFVKDGAIMSEEIGKDEVVMNMADIPLLGNIENIMAAVAVAKLFGIAPHAIGEAIHPFTPLPHRLENIGTFHAITFYNDSLATIPEATIHALSAFGDQVGTLIAGGYDRHLDFTALGTYLAKFPIDVLLLFPDTGAKIWAAVLAANPECTIKKHDVSSMEEAVRLAYKYTMNGKICLLSPASASYNLFKDYADRGNQFRECVVRLAE